MAEIVPPAAENFTERSANHPSKPIMGDDEDFVEYLGRCADHWTDNPPPAPPGFELVECLATPRHWPEYHVADDDFYPAICSSCQYDSLRKAHEEAYCKAHHRRWKSWRILWWLGLKAYSLGIIGSHGVSYFSCKHCGVTRQHHRPRWRGSRPYILGKRSEWWGCLLKRRHIWAPLHDCGLCAKCLPCPDCGSAAQDHVTGVSCGGDA